VEKIYIKVEKLFTLIFKRFLMPGTELGTNENIFKENR